MRTVRIHHSFLANPTGPGGQVLGGPSMNLNTVVELLIPKARRFGFPAGMVAGARPFTFPLRPLRRMESTGSPASRAEPRFMSPPGRRAERSRSAFALFVEEFGFGQGPVFRPDLASRNPDLVNEAFRQYAIDWGHPRASAGCSGNWMFRSASC